MRQITLFLFILIGFLPLSSCSDNKAEQPVEPAKPINLTTKQSEIVTSNSVFAFNLFREIINVGGKANLLFSPLSVEAVLSMMLNIARGETYSQIVSAMGYDSFTLDIINGLYSTLHKNLSAVDKTVHYSTANSLWLNGFSPDKTTELSLMTYYDIYLQNKCFSSEQTAKEINEWCSRETAGLITNVIDKLNPNDLMVIINALYFDGKWKSPFDVSLTKSGLFYDPKGNSANMPFMNDSGTYSAAEDDAGSKICILPFGNGGFNMAIVLPPKKSDYFEFISQFDREKYNDLLSLCVPLNVTLSIPRIKINSEINEELKLSLQSLGISVLFDPESADLSGLYNHKLSLGWIKQKAYMELEEKGVKIAVTTSSGQSGLSPATDLLFIADHPFLFLISESSTNAILFMGSFAGA